MKRHFHKLALSAASLAITAAGTIPAQACGGRGGGRSTVSYSRYAYPSYQRTSCRTAPPPQVIHAPAGISPQAVPVSQIPTAGSAPVLTGQRQLQPVSAARQLQPVSGSRQLQPVSGTQSAAGARQLQPVSAARQLQSVASTQPAASQQTAPAATTSQPSTVQQAASPSSSEASALQMLVSISSSGPDEKTDTQIPEFAPAASQQTPGHVGAWKVTLPGNQSVELVLNADNSFQWTASRNGKTSTFEGQFRLENDRLTLVRSNDLQQMAGTWSGSADQFTFKLDGATTGGLAFQRN